MADRPSVEMSSDKAVDAFYSALLDDDPTALYERAPCGYLSTKPDGTIVKVNQTMLTLTGYSREQLVGRRRFTDLLTPGGRIYHETHYAPMLQMQGSAREIALDIVRTDGKRLPVLVNSILERDDSGSPVVVRTAVFDATERREYERELLRSKERAEASEARATLLARTLQQTLIPPTPPTIEGLDIAAVYRPAGSGDEVGGDFYDIFEIGSGDWVVAIGDVCGKGVEAAGVTALARHTIRAAAVHQRRPADILATLNMVLLHHETDRFCTVTLLRLRHSGSAWTATVGCAGHPLPLLWRQREPAVPIGTFGPLLGVLPSPEFADTEVLLESGASMLLYTDGVTEGRHGKHFFGEEKLATAIRGSARSAAMLAQDVLDEVMKFQAGDPRDDIAIVAIRIPL
ncbi:MAG TPA: SpoIIE family protein phosphatase [Acidimicrobiales bacterium]|nr:SpoIIE family protein phosphatase [Acidimicrobiales bacterium]